MKFLSELNTEERETDDQGETFCRGVFRGKGEVEKKFELEWLTDLCNDIMVEDKIRTNWKKSNPVPVYKGNKDPLECGSC